MLIQQNGLCLIMKSCMYSRSCYFSKLYIQQMSVSYINSTGIIFDSLSIGNKNHDFGFALITISVIGENGSGYYSTNVHFMIPNGISIIVLSL